MAALLLLVQMLAPLTPHICEELWSLAGNSTLRVASEWPREGPTEEAPVEEAIVETEPALEEEEVTTEAAPEEAAT